MIFIMATKDHFPVFFTDSEIMQKAVADLAYLLAATLLLNSVQPVISGATIYPSIYVFPSPKLVIYIYIIYFRIITIALLPTDDLIYIYRCSCWRRMARFSCLYQFNLLLHYWSPSWISTWLQSKVGCSGNELLLRDK